MREVCVFCDIAEKQAPAFVVAANESALAILDIQPLSEGQCLVIPRRHVPWWDEMDEDEIDAVFRLARHTAGKIRAAFAPDCVTMYARGRRVPHAHIFLVPTYKNDPLDRLFNALEGFQEQATALATLQEPTVMRATCQKLNDA